MAKHSIPFAKYPTLLEIEQRHGVGVGHAYNTADSVRVFTSFIAKSLRQGFLNSLPGGGFFSLLMAGSTDAGNLEDELIVLVYCHMDDVIYIHVCIIILFYVSQMSRRKQLLTW